MRREDRAMPETEARALLAAGEYGILATTGPEGPYGVPLSYAVQGDTLYFHGTAQGGLKTKNLAATPRACFTVVGRTEVLPEKFSTRYESVIACGRCAPVAAAAEKRTALKLLAAKYSPAYGPEADAYIDRALDDVAIYALTIETLTGKARR